MVCRTGRRHSGRACVSGFQEDFAPMNRLSLAAGLFAGAVLAASVPVLAGGAAPQKRHAVSLLGEPKLPATTSTSSGSTPTRQRAGAQALGDRRIRQPQPFTVKGQPAAGLGNVFDTLLFNSPDEPSAEYGLLAEWISYPDDFSSVTFGLRPEAKFHDGKPVTPEDVIFSLTELKKSDPRVGFYYQNVVKAEKTASAR